MVLSSSYLSPTGALMLSSAWAPLLPAPPGPPLAVASARVFSGSGPDQLWPQAWPGSPLPVGKGTGDGGLQGKRSPSGTQVPQPPFISCQLASASETHVCALLARSLGSLFYGFLIHTWQKGSSGSTQQHREWPEDPDRKDSWTIKQDLCL